MNKFSGIFANTAAYSAGVGALKKPNISYILDSHTVKYNPWKAEALVGDYLFTDKTFGSEIGSKTVMGICVAPASHFADGKARFMSIKNMSLTDAANGTTAQGNSMSSNPGAGIRWGAQGDVEGITTYGSYPYYLKKDDSAKTESNPWGFVEELSTSTGYYLTSDFDNGRSNNVYPFCENRYMYIGMDSSIMQDAAMTLPYQFKQDGSLNPLFNEARTILSDVKGIENTNVLMGLQAKEWGSDKDANNDVTGDANYPAAKACRLFNPAGSNTQGQWFLPSLPELTYVWANIGKFNQELDSLGASAVAVGNGFDSSHSTDTFGYYLWSSSEYSSSYAWYLGTGNGNVGYDGYGEDGAYGGFRVRAFFAI